MKRIILAVALTSIIYLSTTAYKPNNLDENPGRVLAFAYDSNLNKLDSAVLDAEGNYSFSHLPTGKYNIVFTKAGCKDIYLGDVEFEKKQSKFHAVLDFQPFVKGVPIELRVSDSTAGESLLEGEKRGTEGLIATNPAIMKPAYGISVRETREASDGVATKSETKKVEKAKYGKPLETRSPEPIGYGVSDDREYDAAKAASPTKDAAMAVAIRRMPGKGSGMGSGEVVANSSVKSGQVTAGYWRDLDNWEKWKETNKSADISQYQEKWGFYTDHRFSATFKDADGKALVGTHVKLFDNHNTLHWEAVTDNNGNAEFFANLSKQYLNKDLRNFKIKVSSGERVIEFKINPYTASKEIYNLPIKSNVQPIADIAFVVDATGSMGDEIQYLQAELLDVITRVKKTNKCIDLRMASVFYRDNTDEYLTREADFSSNPADIVNFIYNQSAGGGGDFPEAVDAAMETSLEKLSWSENAISKIIFLVLDAPPHDDSVSAEKIRKYTKMAAEKGIKIIPITASGIDQSTEFLMKYMAIATNGSYIYITDHSGIGGTHAKPTGVRENVQYLNDLMVDIITQNTVWSGCKDSTENTVQGVVEIVSSGQWQVQFYPNPATDYITIKSSIVPDEIAMYDLAGNLVKKIDQVAGDKTKIEIKELLTGVYIVRCRKGEQSLSCRMLVMH